MDYEKEYKRIVGKIKNAYLYAQTDSTKAVLEEIFPELAESEDEKIRHFLMNFVKINDGVNLPPDYAKKALAWIEKQGEKLPAGFYYVNSEGKKFYSEKFKYGNVVLGISANNGKDEQKPEENKGNVGGISPNWSEEDERERKRVVGLLEGWLSTFKETCYAEDCKCGIDWLKSLKDRVQPQNKWKPSDEQIRCLKEVVGHRNLCGLSETALNELLSDLKKLKEGKV